MQIITLLFRPDVTFAVDWLLKNNYLSEQTPLVVLLGFDYDVCCTVCGCGCGSHVFVCFAVVCLNLFLFILFFFQLRSTCCASRMGSLTVLTECLTGEQYDDGYSGDVSVVRE